MTILVLSELWACIYQSLHICRMWHMVNFEVEFDKFEFKVFLLLDWLPKTKEPSLLYYLPIAGGRIIGLHTKSLLMYRNITAVVGLCKGCFAKYHNYKVCALLFSCLLDYYDTQLLIKFSCSFSFYYLWSYWLLGTYPLFSKFSKDNSLPQQGLKTLCACKMFN